MLNSAFKFRFAIGLAAMLVLGSSVASFSQSGKNAKSAYKTIEEERQHNAASGMSIAVKAPSNFPLPVYQNNIISTNFTNTTEGVPVADLTLVTKDQIKTVFEWYKTQCESSGWKIRMGKQSSMSAKEKAGSLFILNTIKGEQQGNITISASTKHPTTIINIVWMKHS